MKIVVSATHTVYDDEGHPLNPWEEYDIKIGPMAKELIAVGLLSEVKEDSPVVEEVPKAETKKASSTKSSRDQATDSGNSQEN